MNRVPMNVMNTLPPGSRKVPLLVLPCSMKRAVPVPRIGPVASTLIGPSFPRMVLPEIVKRSR